MGYGWSHLGCPPTPGLRRRDPGLFHRFAKTPELRVHLNRGQCLGMCIKTFGAVAENVFGKASRLVLRAV